MNSQTVISKNKRRKNRRRKFYDALNALRCNPEDAVSLKALAGLMEQYCCTVDGQIDDIGAYSEEQCRIDERSFVNELLRSMDENGWVTIHTPDGLIQVKADINDYIRIRGASKARRHHMHAVVALHLHERAVSRIRPVIIRNS